MAIGSYKKYREINPKGKHTVGCTYKIGYSFGLFDLKEDAKLLYKETLKLDPANAFAKKAAQQLKKLKSFALILSFIFLLYLRAETA